MKHVVFKPVSTSNYAVFCCNLVAKELEQWVSTRLRTVYQSPALNLKIKRVSMGTPNRRHQEYSKNIIEYKDPGAIVLGFPVWVPSNVPL